eukprot:SAG31_NODE_1562_length_7871_cov_8.208312_4_plen_588_part_00
MSVSRLQSEERYERLKSRLLENEYSELLAVQSVPLVERLLDDALEARAQWKLAEDKYERTRREHLASEHQLLPLKEDNTRLLHENNALHLELIHEAEHEDESHRAHQLTLDKLRSEISDLNFLNKQCNHCVLDKDTEIEKLKERLQELTMGADVGTNPTRRKPRIAMTRSVAAPDGLATLESAAVPQQDLLIIKEQKITQLEAKLVEITTQQQVMQETVRSFTEKINRRDAEIARLNQLLEGGQDYQKLSFEHVNKINQQRMSSLNEQVNFLTSQIVNLENEVLHKDSIQEQSETIHADLLQKITQLQVEAQAQADERAALEQEKEVLEQQLHNQVEFRAAEPEIGQLTRQTLATGLNEQSLRAIVDDDVVRMATQLDSVRKDADDQAIRHHEEISKSRKEIVELKTDIETARRELERARQEQDLSSEENNRSRSAVEASHAEGNRLRAEVRKNSAQLADAESTASALRAEVSRLSSELVDKSSECRTIVAERSQLQAEIQKLQITQQDTESLKASAATARDAASFQESQNLRLRQEHERLEEILRNTMRNEQQLRSNTEEMQEQIHKLEDKVGQAESDCKRKKIDS